MTGTEPDPILARVAADRAAVYSALSVGFYLPGPDLVWEIRSGSFVRGIESSVAWLGPDADLYRPWLADLGAVGHTLGARPPADVLRDLRTEHARLFTGPGRPDVAVFASEYLDRDGEGRGRMDGPSTGRVARWYRGAGFGRAADHRDLPDHVATELEFLHALAAQEADLRREGRSDEAASRRRDTDRFLREHAGRWMPDFARATLAAHPHPFYGALAGLLALHIAMEVGEYFDRSMLPWSHSPAELPARQR